MRSVVLGLYAALLTASLVLSGLHVPGQAAPTTSPPSAGRDDLSYLYPASSWSATGLTTHRAGFPVAGTPSRHTLTSLSVTIDVATNTMAGSFTLAQAPAAADEARYFVAPGSWIDDGGCSWSPGLIAVDPVPAASVVSFSVPSNAYEGLDGSEAYECISIETYVADPEDPDNYLKADEIVGDLTPTYVFPTVVLTPPTRMQLVKGIKTPVWVTVENTGEVTVPSGSRLTARGTAVKSSSVRFTQGLEPGQSAQYQLKLTLRGKKKKIPLRYALSMPGGHTATVDTTARRIARPKPPPAGRYVGAGGKVRFRVEVRGTRRVLTGFRARWPKVCVGREVELDPTVVPGNNIIDRWVPQSTIGGWIWYERVQMRFRGGRALGGYVQQDVTRETGCNESLRFTARRVGR